MADSFSKKEKEKARLKKRQDKEQKKEERKANSSGGGLDSMMAYIDEFGNITDTPPDPAAKQKIDASTIEVSVSRRIEEEVDIMHTGKIEFFNEQKGFGFIRDLNSQEKFFVHVRGLIDDVGEGDKVVFEIEDSPKGPNAVRVKKA